MGSMKIDYDGVTRAAVSLAEIANGVDAKVTDSDASRGSIEAAVTVEDSPMAGALMAMADSTVAVQGSFVSALNALSEALEQIVRDTKSIDEAGARDREVSAGKLLQAESGYESFDVLPKLNRDGLVQEFRVDTSTVCVKPDGEIIDDFRSR